MCDDNKKKALLKIFGRLRPDANDPSVRIIQRYTGNSSKDSSSTQKKKKSKSSRRKEDSDSSVEFPRARITKSNRTLRSSISTKPGTSTSSQITNINEEHSYCKTSSKREEDSETFISKYETDTDDEAEETQQQCKMNIETHDSQLNLKTDTNISPKNSPSDQESKNSNSMNEPFSVLETVLQAENKNMSNREYNDSYLYEFDLTMFGNLFTQNDLKDNFGAELVDETYMPIIDVPHNSNLLVMPLNQTKPIQNSMTQKFPSHVSFPSTPSAIKDSLLIQTVVNVLPLSDTSPSTLGSDSSVVCLLPAVSPPQQPAILPITTQPKADQLPLTNIGLEAPVTSTSSTKLQSVQCNTFPLTTEILSPFPSEMESINPQILHNNAFRRDEGNFLEVDMCLSNIIKTIALESEDRPAAAVQPIDWVNTQHHAPSTSKTQAKSSQVTSSQTNIPLGTSEEMECTKQVPVNSPNIPNMPANIVKTPSLQNLVNNPEGWATLLSYLTDMEQDSKNMSIDDINEVVPLEDIKPTLHQLQGYSNSIQADASIAKPLEPMNTETSEPFRNLYDSSSELISVSDLKISPSSAVSQSEMSQHSTGTNYENYNSTSTSNFSTSGGAIELISSTTAPKQPTRKNRYPGMSIGRRNNNSSNRSLNSKIETITYLSDEQQNCRIHLVQTPPPFSQEPPQIQSSYIRDYRRPNEGEATAQLQNLEQQPAQNFGTQHSEYSRPALPSSKQKILPAQIYETTSSYANSSSIRSFNQKTQRDNTIKSFKSRDQQLSGKPNDSRLIHFQYQQGPQPVQNFRPPPPSESQGDQTFRNSHYSKTAPQSFSQNLQLVHAYEIPQNIRSATPFMEEPQPAQNYGSGQPYNTRLTIMPKTGGQQIGNTFRVLQPCDEKPRSRIQELQYIDNQLMRQIKSKTNFPPEAQLTHTLQPYQAMPINPAATEPRPGQSFGTLQLCEDKGSSQIQELQYIENQLMRQIKPKITFPPESFVPSHPSSTFGTGRQQTGQAIRCFQSCVGGTPQSNQVLGNQPPRQIRVATSFTPEPQPAYTFVSPQSYHNSSLATGDPYPGQIIGTYQSCDGREPHFIKILGNQHSHQIRMATQFTPQSHYTTYTTTSPHARQSFGSPLTSDGMPTPETIIQKLQPAQTVFDPRAYNQRQNFGTSQLHDDRSIPLTITRATQSAPTFVSPRSYNRRTSSTSVIEAPYSGQSFGIPQTNVGVLRTHTIIQRPQSAAYFVAPQSYTTRPVTEGSCTEQILGTPQLHDGRSRPQTITRGPQSAQSFVAPQTYTARPPNTSVTERPCTGQSLGTPQLHDGRSSPQKNTRGPQSVPSLGAPQSYNAKPPDTSVTEAGQSFGPHQSINVRSRSRTISRESRTKENPQSRRTKRACRKPSEKKSLNSRVKHDFRHGLDRTSRINHQHSTRPNLNRSQNPQFQNTSRSFYMMERNTRVMDQYKESSINCRSYLPEQTLPTSSNLYQSMDPNFSTRTQILSSPSDGNYHGYSCEYTQNPLAPIYNQQMQPTSIDIREAPTDNSPHFHESDYIPTNHTIYVLNSPSD